MIKQGVCMFQFHQWCLMSGHFWKWYG